MVSNLPYQKQSVTLLFTDEDEEQLCSLHGNYYKHHYKINIQSDF